MSLLNVLAVLAVGTGLVQIMLRDQDVAVHQLERSNSVAQARALAHSGTTSVAVALRRDFVEAPRSDHLGEAWARAAQEQIALDFGQFAVAVVDARGKFDLNALQPTAIAEQRVFSALLTSLELPEVLAGQITQIISQKGPLHKTEDLIRFGLPPSDVRRLSAHVTATSVRGHLNLNAVTEPLMGALLHNPSAARGLVARRLLKGFLDTRDFAALGVSQPPLAGFTSDVFDVTSMARVGQARVVVKRRLLRDPDTGTVQSRARQ